MRRQMLETNKTKHSQITNNQNQQKTLQNILLSYAIQWRNSRNCSGGYMVDQMSEIHNVLFKPKGKTYII